MALRRLQTLCQELRQLGTKATARRSALDELKRELARSDVVAALDAVADTLGAMIPTDHIVMSW